MRKLTYKAKIVWAEKGSLKPVTGMRAIMLKFQNQDFVECYNEAVEAVNEFIDGWNEEYELIHGTYMGAYEAFMVDRYNSKLCHLDKQFESRDMKIRAFLIGEGACVICGVVDDRYICYTVLYE